MSNEIDRPSRGTKRATPSKVRGETFRECADTIRGMIALGTYPPDQWAKFFEDQAEANDILAAMTPDPKE